MSNEKLTIPQKMNEVVLSVINQNAVLGFEKAYLMANAISELKQLLTPEYMKPIMELQGSKLGFKTDKIYSESQVKEALIEAVFLGVQPYNNEFNIIAGNCYLTKEGLGALLKKVQGLDYSITPKLPRIQMEKGSAAVEMVIEWALFNSSVKTKTIDVPVRVNKMMGTDAVIGKATRKARHWLYTTITGSEIPEGDVTDVDFKVVQPMSVEQKQNISERERVVKHIENAKTIEDLAECSNAIADDEELYDLYQDKLFELSQPQ